MSTRVANIISIVGIIVLGAYIAWLYPGLPDPMPTHWNAAGEVDDYTSKAIGAPLLVAIPIFVFVIFKLIPVMSPRGFRTESFSGTLNVIMTATVLFSCIIGIGGCGPAGGICMGIGRWAGYCGRGCASSGL